MEKEKSILIHYIVIRIKNDVKVIFEDKFLNKNMYYTQNVIIEVLSLIYDRKDFDVTLHLDDIQKKVED